MTELERAKQFRDILDGVTLAQEIWEDQDDIVTFNGEPIGGTISHRNRLEFDRWWPSFKQKLAEYLAEHL